MAILMNTLLSFLPLFLQVSAQASGTGNTTRYWDCCKPSCAWPGKAVLAEGPVFACDVNNNELTNSNAQSACPSGGEAYMCTNESPWAVSDTLSYGYAAVNIASGSEASWCCACYQLTFTSGPVVGQTMIVQATNTGADLNINQFDIAIPGGGFGAFTNACPTEFGTPSSGWGADYGGISSRSDCDSFPESLQAGCYWRFDWFQDANNPSVNFEQVSCPAALTSNTGCIRADDTGATTSTTTTTTTTSANPSVQTQYGECGNGYPTACAPGTSCQYQNAYYSQCL